MAPGEVGEDAALPGRHLLARLFAVGASRDLPDDLLQAHRSGARPPSGNARPVAQAAWRARRSRRARSAAARLARDQSQPVR